MKSNLKGLPSDTDRIRELTTEIAALRKDNAIIEQNAARAEDAADEAGRIKAQLDELAARRARIRGQAFVDGTYPDTAALDAEEADLEKRSRKAREDGTAASHALEILNSKKAAYDQRIAQLQSGCNSLVLDLLNSRFQSTLDRYVAGLKGLVPVIAEADAIRNLRAHFGGQVPRSTSSLMPDPADADVPLPPSLVTSNNVGGVACQKILKPSPADSKSAHLKLLDELAAIGVSL